MTASDTIRAGRVMGTRPWPRHHVTASAWREMARLLSVSPELRFQALWADPDQVYALFTRPDPILVSAPVEAGVYAALSPACAEASWFERAIGDLWGHIAADAVDARPLLDHGDWPVLRPMLARPIPNAAAPEPLELRAPPPDLAWLRFGPVQSSLPGPALFGITLRGERIVQLEARLGFGHRGVLALLRGRTPDGAARLVARISGRAAVAHSLAFAQAAEAALGADVPPRAIALRMALTAIERIATGLHDIARRQEAGARDPASSLDQREAVLRASALAFGRRLPMDVVVPGGLARDLAEEGREALRAALSVVRLPASIEDAALADRVLASLPAGPVASVLPRMEGEGLGRGESADGPVWHWLDFRDGRIAQAFAADPAMRLWPAVERDAQGRALAEVPATVADLSTPGVDL